MEPNKWGYTTDLENPRILKWYKAYKRKLGHPVWCPLSDEERLDFDNEVNIILAQEEIQKRAREVGHRREAYQKMLDNRKPPAV